MKNVLLALLVFCCLLTPALVLAASDSPAAVASAQLSLNLNQAGVAELQTLPGIGPALAERIVSYRDEHGPFRSIDQLTEVKGVGAKKLEKFRGSLSLK